MKAGKLFFALGLLQYSLPVFALSASVLIKFTDTTFNNTQLKAVCLTGGAQCAPESTQAYIAKEKPGNRVFLIDKSKPSIISLQKTAASGNYQVESRLDLTGYKHSLDPQSYGGDSLLTIFPALYPIGKDSFAIAIIATANQMYSGGGANFEVADFIPFLGAPRAGEINAVYRNVPFSCSQMIRACFTGEEYQKSKHCHEERSAFLTIDYRLDKAGGANWNFKWHLTEWPAHASKKMQKKRTVNLPIKKSDGQINSYNATESEEFCGGLL